MKENNEKILIGNWNSFIIYKGEKGVSGSWGIGTSCGKREKVKYNHSRKHERTILQMWGGGYGRFIRDGSWADLSDWSSERERGTLGLPRVTGGKQEES